MKKIILAFSLVGIMLIGAFGGISAFAYVSIEECDLCFQITMNALLDSNDVDGNKITATRKPVYDITLEQLGYVYEFEIASGDGYAVIICDDGNYVAQEVMPHSTSPYAELNEEEQGVYVNTMSYYKAVDGVLCDIETNAQVSEEVFTILEENAILYKTSTESSTESVTVTVEYIGEPDEDYYPMCYRTPMYTGPSLTGGCAAVAGGNIVGYYDRYYEDLIPNHAAGIEGYGSFFYNLEDDYVWTTIYTLYDDMQGDGTGITEANFKSGLQKYCARKGLSCDFTSLMTSGKLNYESVKSSMKAGRPVALLLSTYNICTISFATQKDYLFYDNYSGNHIMVGFGYRDTTYTLTNGSTSHYRFIYVATGYLLRADAYFNIDYATNINNAYGVYIH